VLADHEARATFFQIGAWVERLPEVARDVVARGHEVGNHTWSHIDGSRVHELDVLRDEVARTSAVIARVTGTAPTLLRPPYGSEPGRFARVAAECGLAVTVLWSAQSFDWQDPRPEEIVAQALAEVEPGAIVLLHDGQRESNDDAPRSNTRAALPALLAALRADGYELVTVSELLAGA
jgi:peptidoglycan-N-acetylglucosamine deacetylase